MTLARLALSTALTLAPATIVAQTQPSQTQPSQTQPSTAADRVTFEGRPGAGVTVTLRDPSISLNVSSRAQFRGTFTVPSQGDPQTDLSIRTLRLILSGHAFSTDVRYYVQLALAAQDFEQGSASPLFDAWAQYTAVRDAQLRVGQFFVPFDRARTIREASLQFVDRQQVVRELSLDRDAGVELSSRDLFGLGGRLQYALGVFSGEGRNRIGGDAGFLYVARLQVNPMGSFDDNLEGDLERRASPRLAIGVAGAYNQSSTRAQSTLGATLTHGSYDYLHAVADLHFKWRGLSLLAEGLWRGASQPSHGYVADGRAATEWSRSGWGYLVQLGVMLGARVEAVARWDHLVAVTDTDPTLRALASSRGHELGAGANVYFGGHAYKLQADWQMNFGDDPSTAQHLARVQLQLTL